MQPTIRRIAGTTCRHLTTAYSLIDWQEVAAIVIHGLKILVVFSLLAGRATRRAWDSLPGWSERLGKAYVRLLGLEPTPVVEPEPVVKPEPEPSPAPVVDYASMLEALTVRDLRATCVTLSKAYLAARKADLVALLAELHVNPTL